MNRNVKILSRRLYSPSLKNAGVIEDAQLFFVIFHTFVCNFFPAPTFLPCQIYRQIYRKLEKLIECVLAKLHPSNLAIHKLRKIQYWKKLFTIGFPYKHCNFWPLCLPVKMAPKTMITPIFIANCTVLVRYGSTSGDFGRGVFRREVVDLKYARRD